MDHWINAAPTALALMILLDQFPRTMFRADPRFFATHAKVLGLAKDALEMGHDLSIPEPERQFFYLPFMHSEDLADQTRAIEWMETRMPQTGQGNVIHARAHDEFELAAAAVDDPHLEVLECDPCKRVQRSKTCFQVYLREP